VEAKVCAFANQKGGVGKTTTVNNLGVAIAKAGYKVLCVDLDAQANLTDGLGVDPYGVGQSVFDLLKGQPVERMILDVGDVHLLPASQLLATADLEFSGRIAREQLLRKGLRSVLSSYDYIMLDCPPNLGLLTVNAFVAATHVYFVSEAEYYALSGLGLIWTTFEACKELNATVELAGVIITQYDKRKVLHRDVVRSIEEQGQFVNKVFETKIRCNVDLASAPSHGMSIFEYDPKANGAFDYAQLAREFLR